MKHQRFTSTRQVQIRTATRPIPQIQEQEEALLAQLFSRNARPERLAAATPPGYSYVRVTTPPPSLSDASGPIMQIAAHPGDGPDFFYATWLKLAAHPAYRQSYHEILLTDGELGVDGWHPERTRQVRIEEAYAGAELVGSRLHFLGSPDGGLSELEAGEREQLITRLAQKLKTVQPAILIVHPPLNDHPDHAASFQLTLEALKLHARTGGRAPTLLTHDVEFGLQQATTWTSPEGTMASQTTYPFYAPGLIVDISSTHHTAQIALRKHQTQMLDPLTGQPKLYADLIHALAQLRGLQCQDNLERSGHVARGQGFTHLVLPGLTQPENLLLQRLPAENVYMYTKKMC